MITAEQFLATQKSQLEIGLGLGNTAFEGAEKLLDLNVQTFKAAFSELGEAARAALSVKDAQELLSLQAGLLQPVAEKAAAYSRHLYEIVASTGAEISKVAEATAAEAQARFMAVVDTAVKNAPAGTENAVALVRSAVAAASNAIEGAQKAAKQATDAAEANFQALSSNAVRATQSATQTGSKKRAAQ